MANVTVKRREGESIESLLRRFKHKLQQERVITDMRKNRFYKSPSEERRRKQHINFFRRLKKKKKEENRVKRMLEKRRR